MTVSRSRKSSAGWITARPCSGNAAATRRGKTPQQPAHAIAGTNDAARDGLLFLAREHRGRADALEEMRRDVVVTDAFRSLGVLRPQPPPNSSNATSSSGRVPRRFSAPMRRAYCPSRTVTSSSPTLSCRGDLNQHHIRRDEVMQIQVKNFGRRARRLYEPRCEMRLVCLSTCVGSQNWPHFMTIPRRSPQPGPPVAVGFQISSGEFPPRRASAQRRLCRPRQPFDRLRRLPVRCRGLGAMQVCRRTSR